MPENSHGSAYLRFRRFLSFIYSVARNVSTLVLTAIGSAVLSIPAWIQPLLSPAYAAKMDTVLGIPAHYYGEIAKICLISGIFLACFFAWEEEHIEKDKLQGKQSKPVFEGEVLGQSRGPDPIFPDFIKYRCRVRVRNVGIVPSIIRDWVLFIPPESYVAAIDPTEARIRNRQNSDGLCPIYQCARTRN